MQKKRKEAYLLFNLFIPMASSSKALAVAQNKVLTLTTIEPSYSGASITVKVLRKWYVYGRNRGSKPIALELVLYDAGVCFSHQSHEHRDCTFVLKIVPYRSRALFYISNEIIFLHQTSMHASNMMGKFKTYVDMIKYERSSIYTFIL